MSKAEKELRSARIRALRKAFELTQAQVAERSGGRLTRTYANRVEATGAPGQTMLVYAGLGAAFGVSERVIEDYLTGKLVLSEVRQIALAESVARGTPRQNNGQHTVSESPPARTRKRRATHD